MNNHQFKELMLQSLQHERGGVLVYQTALECVINADLKKEWAKYLEQTKNHVELLTRACRASGIDPYEITPGCQIVQESGKALVLAMKMALAQAQPAAAELVACDCVVLAETKDHADWGLLGECAKALSGDAAAELTAAYQQVEDEEDEHLYHSKGWCRELWLQALGLKAELPPPEERKNVKTAIEAAQVAEKSTASRRR